MTETGEKSTAEKPTPPASEEKPGKVFRETILLLGFAILLALVVKTFFVQSFYIPSESMEPGLEVNDRILVQKPSYWFGGEPQRGDVIVFDDPGGWLNGLQTAQPMSVVARGLARIGLYPTGGHLVKRVIGVEGDVIECCDDQGRILVNGEPIDADEFIEPQKKCDGPMIGCNWTAGPVPEGTVFVMGDNRDDSADSTVHLCRGKGRNCEPSDAFVPVDLVVGKVFALAWPLSRAGLVHRPDVFEDVPDDPPADLQPAE